jgi:histidine phosphotransfer protein HptB
VAAEPIVVMVERDLEDLVPLFLAQRKADQDTLARALPLGDFEAIRRAAHGMVGAGTSYGFEQLSKLGQLIVDAGRAGDVPALQQLKLDLDDYLARLVVKYM